MKLLIGKLKKVFVVKQKVCTTLDITLLHYNSIFTC